LKIKLRVYSFDGKTYAPVDRPQLETMQD